MSLTTKLAMFAAFIFFLIFLATGNRRRKKRIIFFGDSITEAGALFGGYIQRLGTYLVNEGVAHKYELTGMGKSGHKVTDLLNRLGKDILERGADVVVIFIGTNDVWHKYLYNTGTPIDLFLSTYQTIIDRLLAADIKIVLCTPAVIGERTDHSIAADNDLENYCLAVKQLAETNHLPVVDLRTVFKDYLLENNPDNADAGFLTKDGVHLSDKGNVAVAEELLQVLKNEKLIKAIGA